MREMFILNLNWFMQTLLARKDNMSMASSLEVRVPFCDYRLVEYAYNMPWDIKALAGREKGILRKAFENDLPNEIAWRKKSPYPKTHNPVYFARVKELLTTTETLEGDDVNLDDILGEVDGILVPGGFGSRGIEGKSTLANMQEHTVYRILAFALVCKLQLLNLQGMYSV